MQVFCEDSYFNSVFVDLKTPTWVEYMYNKYSVLCYISRNICCIIVSFDQIFILQPENELLKGLWLLMLMSNLLLDCTAVLSSYIYQEADGGLWTEFKNLIVVEKLRLKWIHEEQAERLWC